MQFSCSMLTKLPKHLMTTQGQARLLILPEESSLGKSDLNRL